MGIAFAIAQAVTIRMGHELGAKNFHSAKRASYAGNALTLFFMLSAALVYWCFPHALIGADININNDTNIEIIRDATLFFAIAALYQIFEAARITLFGALRAFKDTRYTLVTSIIFFWGIALTTGYFLLRCFHMGGAGLWWGMVLSGAMGVVLLSYRLKLKFNQEATS